MDDERIREKIEKLVRLAKRPGTPGEGEAARLAAIRLSQTYGIACEFTAGGKGPSSTRPTASAHQPESHSPKNYDMEFWKWISALNKAGWTFYETVETKIGLQIRFRKLGYGSEIRVTQRRNTDLFEAEHVMNPDPDRNGDDWSYTAFMCISLPDLLRHIKYAR